MLFSTPLTITTWLSGEHRLSRSSPPRPLLSSRQPTTTTTKNTLENPLKSSKRGSFTLALLGIEALDLQSVDSPQDLVEHHVLLRGYSDGDPSLRQAARERLRAVNDTVLAMMDTTKSERRAVSALRVGYIRYASV